MDALETVQGAEITTPDALYMKKREDVAKMRASLLSCSDDDIMSATKAMQNITVLRVYHQIARIIKYLEMMDKIEEKLYDALDHQLDKMNPDSPTTWMQLLNIQERLQKNITDSHKILQPYLNLEEFKLDSFLPTSTSSVDPSSGALIIPRDQRDRIRASAQMVLNAIDIEEVADS